MPPCLTLSIIRCGSKIKWSNPGKGVAPSPTPWCSSYRKGNLRVTLDYGRQQLYLLYGISTIVGYLMPNLLYTYISNIYNFGWVLWHINRDIGPAVRVFANGPGDLGSIPGRVIPKTLKMELDTTLLNTQHYKVRFKGKVEQSREWSSALPYTLV